MTIIITSIILNIFLIVTCLIILFNIIPTVRTIWKIRIYYSKCCITLTLITYIHSCWTFYTIYIDTLHTYICLYIYIITYITWCTLFIIWWAFCTILNRTCFATIYTLCWQTIPITTICTRLIVRTLYTIWYLTRYTTTCHSSISNITKITLKCIYKIRTWTIRYYKMYA
jgi:hypothetical protein